MKIKTSYIVIIALLVLSPLVSLTRSAVQEETVIEANNWDSGVSVVGGETIYYDINQIAYPAGMIPDNFTIPDLEGIQLFVKVGAVFDDFEFWDGPDPDDEIVGTLINYGFGLKLTEDLIFGFDITELPNLITATIPAGSATPAVFMNGVPHFNFTFAGPSIFVLNDDWAEHEVMLEDIGFDVTTTTEELTIGLVNGTGQISATWRKSDGILTHIILDNLYSNVLNLNATGFTIEATFDSMEMVPLDIYPGMVVNLNAAELEYTLETTGNFSDEFDTTILDEINSYRDEMLDQTVVRIIVDDVMGIYYKCSIYVWNPEDGALWRLPVQVIFNGFLFNIPAYDYLDTPLLYDDHYEVAAPGAGPFITPDWDLYEGQMLLMKTGIDIMLNDVLDIVLPGEEDYTQYSSQASIDLVKRGNLYYYEVAASVEHEFNQTASPLPEFAFEVADFYDAGFYQKANATAWLAFSKTGIIAGFGVEGTIHHEQYDDDGVGDLYEGTADLSINIRIVNPEFNPLPPDEAGGGFIPGFTWLIAVPAVLGVTLLTFISRKKK